MIRVFVGGLSGGLMTEFTGIPGSPSSIATTFDGYPMAKGQARLALGLGVWASFFGR